MVRYRAEIVLPDHNAYMLTPGVEISEQRELGGRLGSAVTDVLNHVRMYPTEDGGAVEVTPYTPTGRKIRLTSQGVVFSPPGSERDWKETKFYVRMRPAALIFNDGTEIKILASQIDHE